MLSALITARDQGDRLSEQELVVFGSVRGLVCGLVRFGPTATIAARRAVPDR